jgi:hypothetical protein
MNEIRIHGIVAALALAIGGAAIGQAQSNPSPRPAAEHPVRKGGSEGIKVNGYWTIEVKNPDGTIASHTEFENALQASGMLGLAALLAGNSASGGLGIMLNGAHWILQNFIAAHGYTSLQLSGGPEPVIPPESVDSPCGICLFAPSSNSYLGSFGVATKSNLSMSGPTLGSSGAFQGAAQVRLTVDFTANANAPINDVETVLTSCFPNITPGSCVGGGNNIFVPGSPSSGGGDFWIDVVAYVFTQKNLDGLNGDPSPVSVTNGQSIGITVTLTFQ